MTMTIGLWESLTTVRTLPDHRLAAAAMALAAPDLAYRLKTGSSLDGPEPASFYRGDWRGYTDYPTLPADVRVA